MCFCGLKQQLFISSSRLGSARWLISASHKVVAGLVPVSLSGQPADGNSAEAVISRLQIDPVMAETLQICQAEMSEVSVVQKPEKLLERCKYWLACKNGDECVYHQPVSPCKAFANCKFAAKCLFAHPNCKYDAKCPKPDRPFTHRSRRIPVLPPKPVAPPAPPSSGQLCRYFPACKTMECPFYRPKHCRLNTQCTRPGRTPE
ncbi:unnamed protein product [Nyctereutes procyonoides]|uniref:Zinc finger CCCH domain-containing protein 14 n=1 Tax=Nyctereutes procyonoides TaxID=34880 RepID=A0A811XVU2_NYCPR|nr:unnamed protein product [Nyctereutes procyonoides]